MKQFKGKRKSFSPFTRKPHKMVKNAQTIRRLYPTNARYHVVSTWNTADKLSVFDHFAILRGWHLKG